MEKIRCKGPLSVLVALVLALSMGACSGDDEGADPARDRPGADSSSAGSEKVVVMQASAGKVTGTLPRKVRRRVVTKVSKRVDKWFVAGWLGRDYPRSRMAHSWPGFTKGLTAQARKDKAETTNAKLAPRIEGVTPVHKLVKVDILAVDRKAVGATARFRLVFDTEGKVERRVHVRGRLSLTPGKGGWKVFGYDVDRSVGASAGAGQKKEHKPKKATKKKAAKKKAATKNRKIKKRKNRKKGDKK